MRRIRLQSSSRRTAIDGLVAPSPFMGDGAFVCPVVVVGWRKLLSTLSFGQVAGYGFFGQTAEACYVSGLL